MQQLIRESTVRNAASSRKKLRDTKNTDLINRLENVFDSAEAKTLVWHRMCYAHFMDKSKIERLQKTLSQCRQRRKSVAAAVVLQAVSDVHYAVVSSQSTGTFAFFVKLI